MTLELRVKNSQASPENRTRSSWKASYCNPGSCPGAFHLRFTALCRRTFGGRCGMFLTTTVASFVAQNPGTTRTDCVTNVMSEPGKRCCLAPDDMSGASERVDWTLSYSASKNLHGTCFPVTRLKARSHPSREACKWPKIIRFTKP
jgi:hypothetical protein